MAAHQTQEEENRVTYPAHYVPGSAYGIEVRKGEERWTLLLVRDLRHAREKVQLADGMSALVKHG